MVYGLYSLSDKNTTSIKNRDDNGSGNQAQIIRYAKDFRKIPYEFKEETTLRGNVEYEGRCYSYKAKKVNKYGQVTKYIRSPG